MTTFTRPGSHSGYNSGSLSGFFYVLLLALLFVPSPSVAQNELMNELFEQLQQAQQNSNWDQATRTLNQLLTTKNQDLKTILVAHKSKMDQTIANLKYAESLRDSNELKEAITQLEATITMLNTKYHAYDLALQDVVAEKLKTYKNELAKQNNPGFWQETLASLLSTLKENAIPIMFVLSFIFVYFIIRIIAALKATHYEISLENQVDPAATSNELNNALTQEFDYYLKSIVSEVNQGGDLDGLVDLGVADLDRMSLGQNNTLDISNQLNSTPIKIGLITVSLQNIAQLINRMFPTSAKTTITGALSKDNSNHHVLRIQKKSKFECSNACAYIEGRALSREQAIAQAATQLIICESDSIVTKDWRSLDAFIKAKRILSEEPDEKEEKQAGTSTITANLKLAKNLLQKSVAIDPSNWIARYRLADVIRKLDDCQSAYWQYNYILDQLCNKNMEGSDANLRRYISKQPAFPLLVECNKIISMSKTAAANMNSNNEILRQKGFEDSKYVMGDLNLLSEQLGNLCSIKDKALLPVAAIDELQLLFMLYKDSGHTIAPGKHTQEQLTKIWDLSLDNEPLKNKFQKPVARSGLFKRIQSETNIQEIELVVKNLIYQVYAAICSTAVNLYEYHSNFSEDQFGEIRTKLFSCIEKIELWFSGKRMDLYNENRNIYAYSHAVAHNSVGRSHFTELKRMAAQENCRTLELKHHFSEAEKFLKWAIGYHLPAGFADPYIDLAALYLEALEHNDLREFVPENCWINTEYYLTKAISLNPHKQKAHYLLGTLYQSRIYEDELLSEEEQQSDQANFQKALASYKNAGEHGKSYFRIAELFQSKGEYEKAVIKLEQCMNISQIYDKQHQLYLELSEKIYRDQYNTLLKDYDESGKHQLLSKLQKVRNLDGEINQVCFTGSDKVNTNKKCSQQLNMEKGRETTLKLTELKEKLNSLQPAPISSA